MTSVCLVSYFALPVIDPRYRGEFGGGESRAWLIARGLARQPGLHVRMIVRHSRRVAPFVSEGVHVSTHVDPLFLLRLQVGRRLERLSRFPWVRVKQWAPSLLWQAPELAVRRLCDRRRSGNSAETRFTSERADVFLTFGASRLSRTVLEEADRHAARSVLLLQSDADVAPPEGVNDFGEPGDVRAEVVRRADVVIAQNEHQQTRVLESFNRQAVLLINPLELERWPGRHGFPDLPRRYLLWVGRAERFHKRPQEMLKAAARLPELPVVMVLNPGDAVFEAELRRSRPPNVTILTAIPHSRMPDLFASAAAFVSTSSSQYEGLPNVFLQAAASLVPIVSLEHAPQPFASSGGLVLASGIESLVSQVRQLWEQPDECRRIAERGRAWVKEHCSLESYCQALQRQWESLPVGRL